jgi:hypothetical protein
MCAIEVGGGPASSGEFRYTQPTPSLKGISSSFIYGFISLSCAKKMHKKYSFFLTDFIREK